jgi:hypothetical protein
MNVRASLALLLGFALIARGAPLAQEHTIVFHNPDREAYVEGPGLVRLDAGAFVAVVPIVPREEWSRERRLTRSETHILKSTDSGKSWQPLATLPFYSAVPWVHDGTLYLFANKAGAASARNADLLLLRSRDLGKSWSEPVTLFQGNYWNCHTSMVQRDGKLYWAIDDLSLGSKRGPRLVAGDLTKDIMSPASWRISEPVKFPGAPPAMFDAKFASQSDQYLEPNVIDVNGRLRLLSVVKIKRQTAPGFCAVLDATDDGTQLDLKFTRFNAMPGGNLKFCIVRDDVSNLFWATSNLPADSENTINVQQENFRGSAGDRRFLMLHYSLDALNWFPAGCIAHAPKLSQSFMYARPVIDGDDLAIICRTSINAPNQHDADHATFHRVRDFRKLAMKLTPEPETPTK